MLIKYMSFSISRLSEIFRYTETKLLQFFWLSYFVFRRTYKSAQGSSSSSIKTKGNVPVFV